jgi:UDP-N-acetylmuramoyl-tripeptide--D-alanyl-D-alanine ligase
MASELMEFSALSNAIGGRYYSFSNQKGFKSVSMDSRAVKDGALFFALKGKSSDGHKFVEAAFSAGADAAVVEDSALSGFRLLELAEKSKKDLIVVENTLRSLQDSARVYLEQFPRLLKIGITGSAGKTTTKETASAIISYEKDTIMNQGNPNSETGLPLSVFNVRRNHEVGIFELGMNRKGEIDEIAFVLKPNIALITNIGSSHIEFFGSQEGILKEKKCIFKYLKETDTALIPKKDKFASDLADGVTGNVKFYGEDSFKELTGTRSLGLMGSEITWAGKKINFGLPGKHYLDDVIAAIAIAKEVKAGDKAIKMGLEAVKPLFGRGEILKGRTTVIRDCYNANPESTAKSIEFCDSLEWQGRKIYVIADMLELGNTSQDAHRVIGELLAGSKADCIFLFGELVKTASAVLNEKNIKYVYTNNMDTLSSALDNFVKENDLVLLKGSRGCALERLSDMLTEVK